MSSRCRVTPLGRKGIGSIFPNPKAEPAVLAAAERCEANEPGDAGRGPGKSCLFLLRSGILESVRPERGSAAP